MAEAGDTAVVLTIASKLSGTYQSAVIAAEEYPNRIFVVDTTGDTPHVFINPEIVETSGSQTGEEGCLSVPGKCAVVTRANYVKVRAYDLDMKPFEMEGTELLARAILHENDHLDGHLYVEKAEGEIMDVE